MLNAYVEKKIKSITDDFSMHMIKKRKSVIRSTVSSLLTKKKWRETTIWQETYRNLSGFHEMIWSTPKKEELFYPTDPCFK